ncbi:MAG: V4R domain-containing protein [Candidatus Odinarchaeia archaeon]
MTSGSIKGNKKRGSIGKIIPSNKDKKRFMVIDVVQLQDMFKTYEEILGDAVAFSLEYEAGLRSGKKLVINYLKSHDITDDLIEVLSEIYDEKSLGWYNIKKIKCDEHKKKIFITIKNSFIAHKTKNSNKPICYYISGTLAGCLEGILGNPYFSYEIKCESMGDPFCFFIAKKTE